MPNIENINRMIDAIKKEKTRIYMGTFLQRAPENVCGTAACLAGWANVLRAADENGDYRLVGFGIQRPDSAVFVHDYESTRSAADFMGIDDIHADRLFYGRGVVLKEMHDARDRHGLSALDALDQNVLKRVAVHMLESIRDTGAGDWPTSLAALGITHV